MSDDDVEDTSEKWVDTSVTMSDLRRNDEDWRPLPRPRRRALSAGISAQIPYFRDKPLMDSTTMTVHDYTTTFLSQPGAYGWTLDVEPALFCELAYEGFLNTGLELPASGGEMIQMLLPWIDPVRNSLDFKDAHISR
eukprot:TRINITY_DN33834_c0_g2_i1.p1 TRINITY_DN33834_c0_g2~~TRINITY_DN33834_c0_g2_i1.p1  ORF type:complete len:137 (-),score=15.64 TRINITY_DN33834_c0_g2_i1:75-485(-)